MDDLDQLHAALIKADAAGDTASAKVLADHIRSLSAPAPAAAKATGGDALAQVLADPAMKKQFEQAMSNRGGIGSGMANYVLGRLKGVMAPIDGAAQLLGNGVASAAHAIAPGSGFDQWAAGEAKNTNNAATERERIYQPLTAGSAAAGFGNLQSQVMMPIKGMQAARGAGVMGKVAAGAGTGAAVGALQPVYGAGEKDLASLVTGTSPVDYWGEKGKQVALGTALGGALPAVTAGIGGVFNALRPIVAPKATVGDQLLSGLAKAKAAGEATPGAGDAALPGAANLPSLIGSRDPAAVLARVRAAEQLVPGSMPTTAQVAGVPELVMAEKVLKNNPAYRGPFEDRAIANNQARLGQLLSVAKTPAELEAANAARRAEAAPLYDAAKAAVLPVDGDLSSLLSRPSAQDAIQRGMKLAAERGEKVVPPESGSIGGNMLQYMKMGLDDMQSAGRMQGIGSHEAGALGDTQTALQSWIEKNSPDYLAANSAYAKASQAINTMQAAQDLYGGLSNGTMNAAGDISPMLSQYRTQLAKALKGSPYGMEPEAQKSLEAIQADLQRETISNSIKSSGSDTAFNLQAPNWLAGQLYGKAMDGKSMLGRIGAGVGGFMTGGPMGAAGGALGAQKAGEFVGNRVNAEFQKAMLDPQYFAKLLGDALERQSAGASTLQKLAPVGARGATVGAENVISPSP